MKKDIELALEYEQRGEEFYSSIGEEDQARQCFCMAALYGEGELKAEALCNLALLTREPYAQLALYQQAAEEGSAHALNMIGVCLRNLGENSLTTQRWFLDAARAGSPCGMYNSALQVDIGAWRKQILEPAVQMGHQPSIKLMEELLREEGQYVDPEKLERLLDAAKSWAGKPVAILGIFEEDACCEKDLLQTICALVKELEQSVILLVDCDWTEDGQCVCLGYDYGQIGLGPAMENEYFIRKGWVHEHCVSGRVSKENIDAFCEAVELALTYDLPF